MADVFLSRTGYRPVTATSVPGFSEAAQDAVGSILTDTSSIDLTYNDAGNTITADLTATGVTPGSYTNTDLTVDAQGRITSATNGAVADDFMSGLYFIAALNTKTIPIYHQMIVKGGSLILDGSLIVDGQLYMEA